MAVTPPEPEKRPSAPFARQGRRLLKGLVHIFAVVHGITAILFAISALILILIAGNVAFIAVSEGLDRRTAQDVIEAVGLLAAAVVGLQMAQTIWEEEIVRGAHISAPTRVRRFLSRFFAVVVVALAVEGLVATFQAVHEDMERLLYAAAIVLATGGLLAAWGLFVHLNRSAEELEPEAMEKAKREDRKLEQ